MTLRDCVLSKPEVYSHSLPQASSHTCRQDIILGLPAAPHRPSEADEKVPPPQREKAVSLQVDCSY